MYFIDLKSPTAIIRNINIFVALNEKGDLKNAVLYEL